MQRYADATVVIKLGGHVMGSDEAMDEFARDVALMWQVGVNPVIVHGGGPMINDMLARLNIKSEFVNGKRVTDAATMEVVEMVLSGLVNARIVQAISEQGGRAVGVSGKDSGLIVCDPEDPALGLVGNPTQVNPRILRDFADKGIIPVAPLGMGHGETYNINGDTAAGAIAGAGGRPLAVVDGCGGRQGRQRDVTDLTASQINEMIADGTIAGGMIPKVQTALDALEGGVRAAVILDGRAPNACLLELFTEHGAGSIIRKG